MIGGGNHVMESSHPTFRFRSRPRRRTTSPSIRGTRCVRRCRNLKYGSVTIIVQDGVIIQIDRTEKRRLQSRRGNSSHAQ